MKKFLIYAKVYQFWIIFLEYSYVVAHIKVFSLERIANPSCRCPLVHICVSLTPTKPNWGLYYKLCGRLSLFLEVSTEYDDQFEQGQYTENFSHDKLWYCVQQSMASGQLHLYNYIHKSWVIPCFENVQVGASVSQECPVQASMAWECSSHSPVSRECSGQASMSQEYPGQFSHVLEMFKATSCVSGFLGTYSWCVYLSRLIFSSSQILDKLTRMRFEPTSHSWNADITTTILHVFIYKITDLLSSIYSHHYFVERFHSYR